MTFNNNVAADFEAIGNNPLIKNWQALFSIGNDEPQYESRSLMLYRARSNLSVNTHVLVIDGTPLPGEFTNCIVIGR